MDSLEAQIRADFGRLKTGEFEIASDKDKNYNCIAWAMGKSDQYWWPDPDAVWPESAPMAETVEAFVAAFATEGFTPCVDCKPIVGVEKIALYTFNGKPTHAAIMLGHGKWHSKLGKGHDVYHFSLACIGGAHSNSKYGDATHFFERPEPATPRPQMPNKMYEFAKTLGVTNAAISASKQGSKPAKPQKAKKRR